MGKTNSPLVEITTGYLVTFQLHTVVISKGETIVKMFIKLAENLFCKAKMAELVTE